MGHVCGYVCGMCVDMCVDMCADMRVDMCADMRVDICVSMRADACVWARVEACVWARTCRGMRVGTCHGTAQKQKKKSSTSPKSQRCWASIRSPRHCGDGSPAGRHSSTTVENKPPVHGAAMAYIVMALHGMAL